MHVMLLVMVCNLATLSAIFMSTIMLFQVADLIPGDWSIALISKFMLNTVRSSLHEGRQARICSQLAYRDYFLAKKDYLLLKSTAVNLSDNRLVWDLIFQV